MTMEFLGSVELRNERKVYKQGAEFIVEQIGKRGERTADVPVPEEVVDFVHLALSGEEVWVEDAVSILESSPFDIPYDYGHKLQYYAQDVLIILIVQGKATYEKVSRRFHYHISSVG